jgi:3-deoxy-D-manno-octulosonate 8-phosphate phosphatase (KDO 8-P phosphatase)
MKISFKDIDLIVYDFDGVLTDNRVLVLEDGREGVFCSRSDGLAIGMLKQEGVRQVIISTETNPVVSARAHKLGIEVLQDILDKKSALEQFCQEQGLDPNRVVFIGNDLNDVEAMKSVGFALCPQDAAQEVRDIAHQVIPRWGGDGVVREFWNILTKEGDG